MVVHPPVDAETLAKRLIDELSSLPGIREVWLSMDRDDPIFWVITDALSNTAEHAFYEATNILYDAFPGARWDLHMLNPVYYPEDHDMRQSVPAKARRLKSFRDE